MHILLNKVNEHIYSFSPCQRCLKKVLACNKIRLKGISWEFYFHSLTFKMYTLSMLSQFKATRRMSLHRTKYNSTNMWLEEFLYLTRLGLLVRVIQACLKLLHMCHILEMVLQCRDESCVNELMQRA